MENRRADKAGEFSFSGRKEPALLEWRKIFDYFERKGYQRTDELNPCRFSLNGTKVEIAYHPHLNNPDKIGVYVKVISKCHERRQILRDIKNLVNQI